jgi:hypothetical protein
VKKAIALVNKPGYIPMGTHWESTWSSLSRIDGQQTPQYIRKGSIRTSTASPAETWRSSNDAYRLLLSRTPGKGIAQIKLPKDTLVLTITGRQDEHPLRDLRAAENDTVIILTTQESIDRVDALFTRRV